ncbi:hypothetical protein C0989_007611 [Termitomyces sp. Mn162]|nr:hypothetical protein C0989_007611 [Termitomyces sp. Mn162]
MSPRLATTPRNKGKGKGKARDKEDKDIEDQIEETFTDKRLVILLCWQKVLTVVDTGMEAGVKLEKAKGKVTVSLEKQQEYKCTQGACDNCWADNNPEGCWYPTGVQPCYHCDSTKKSCLYSGQASRSTGKGGEDVEMRETTPLAMVTKMEQEASDMEVEVVPIAAEEEERAEEGNWSNTPLCQVGDNELEWLGKDLGWPTPLTTAALLMDFDERVAGVERRFQRELEAAREELLAARACYTVARQTLVTLAGYWRDCQAFLAWQEENNVGEGDWEEAEVREVPDDDADLDA